MVRKKSTYPNRSDKRTPQVPTGLPYGEATALRETQQQQPAVPDPSAILGAAAGEQPPPPISAPTNRPLEPLTAGLSTGPGVGPEALGTPGLNELDQIRAIYKGYPSAELLRLIRSIEQGG